MAIPISSPDQTDLRKTQHTGSANLSIFKPQTILAAQVNGAHDRGARSVAYDNGTGTFSLIHSFQLLWVGTAPGRRDVDVVRIKSISGTASAGTITLDENGVVWADNYHLTIKHFYGPEPIPPRINNKIFYKFFDTAYSDQNSKPPPVCLEKSGNVQVGRLDATTGELVFDIDLTDSYAVAQGATKTGYALSVAPAAGATVDFNTSTGIGTVTVDQQGEWWATASVTDSNGKSQELFIALKADNSPYRNYRLNSYDAGYGQGVRMGITVFGEVTLADFPDEALVVEWYDNTFDGQAGFVNVYDAGDNVLAPGYIRGDTASDDFSAGGTHEVSFEITTIDNVLDNIYLSSVSLEAVNSPSKWYEYARWLTVGRAIHHLLKWHSPIMELIGVRGLLDNTLKIKGAKFEGGSIRQMANTLANQRGIFAQLTCDKLGRLHLARDSQRLNQAGRDALPDILEISEADISGPVRIRRQPEQQAATGQLSGFSFDGSKSQPFVSIIPGYREDGISYSIPARRGTQSLNITNQVLASQTDANEKLGRAFAVANNPIKGIDITFRGNYIGALTPIPTDGWYPWGIADASLARQLPLNGTRLVCRSVSLSTDDNGDLVTSATFEPEAIGPDGIPGNYPTSMPAPPNPPPPRWEAPASLPALVSFSSIWYRDNNDPDWTELDEASYNHGCPDPWWKVKQQTTDPRGVILLAVGEAGLVVRKRGISGAAVDLTPVEAPPDTWSDTPDPTVNNLSLIQILGDPWIESRFYILARLQLSGSWRGWLLASDDDCRSFSYVELYDGVTLPDEIRPIWAAVNGSHLLVTVWTSDEDLRLLQFDPSDLSYVDEFDLGSCTLAELDAFTYIAHPATVIDDDDLWHVFGRLNAPQGLADPEQVIKSANAGASWSSVENGQGGEYCAALVVGPDDGGDREYWGVFQ